MTNPTDNTPEDYSSYTAEQLKELYPQMVHGFFEDIRSRACDCLDFGEAHELWQSLSNNVGATRNITGWMMALATLEEMQASGQARWEMVSSGEHTQYAVQLANTIHDLAMQMKSLALDLASYKAHYLALVTGRRVLDINYTTTDGDFVENSALLDSVTTTAAIKFNNERLEQEEKIRRQKPIEFCRYVGLAETMLKDVLETSACLRSAVT